MKSLLPWMLTLACTLALASVAVRSHRTEPSGPVASDTGRSFVESAETAPGSSRETARSDQVRTFEWSQVEAADLREFVRNLRRIRCPEEDVRDLVIARVRRSSKAGAGGNESEDPEVVASQLLDEVLGPQWRLSEALAVDERTTLGHLGFLPREQAVEVAAMEDRAEARTSELLVRSSGFLTDEDQVEMRRIQQEKLQDIANVLGWSNYTAYLKKTHPGARELANEGFAFRDDQEFMAVLGEREMARLAHPGTGPEVMDPASEARLRELLGNERYRAYQHSQLPEFRELRGLVTRFGLGIDVASSVQDWVDQVRSRPTTEEPGVADPAASESVRTLHAQVRQVLGTQAYQAWCQSGLGPALSPE